MSLTSIIKRADIRNFLLSIAEGEMASMSFNTGSRLYFQSNPNVNYSKVGTAYDYLIRFELLRIYKQSQEQKWISEKGAERLLDLGNTMGVDAYLNNKWKNDALKSIKLARAIREEYFLNSSDYNLNKLINICLKLSTLDEVYRSNLPLFTSNSEEGLIPEPNNDEIELVNSLFKASREFLNSSIFSDCSEILLNPDFFDCSELVGGADADIITSKAIIDLKTSKKTNPDEIDKAQIVGYYFLLLMNNKNLLKVKRKLRQPLPAVKEIGIFYARTGKYYYINCENIVIKRHKLKQFIKLINSEPVIERSSLEDIHGIGKKRAQTLSNMGLDTIKKLSESHELGENYKKIGRMKLDEIVFRAKLYVKKEIGLRCNINKVREYFKFEDSIYLDIETTGLSSDSFIWLIGMYFTESGKIKQGLARNIHEEKKLLLEVVKIFSETKGKIVIYSGKYFDKNGIEARMKKHGIEYIKNPEFVDVLTVIRKCLILPWKYDLKTMGNQMGYTFKHQEWSGKDMPTLFRQLIDSGDKNLKTKLFEYNRDDVESLSCIVSKIREILAEEPSI